VVGEQSLVADAGKLAFQARQGVVQEAECGVAVGLGQGAAADAFGLLGLQPSDRRLFACGTADPSAVAMQGDDDQRCGASSMPGLPRLAQRRHPWRRRSIEDEDLERRVTGTEVKLAGCQPGRHRQTSGPEFEVFKKWDHETPTER